MDDSVTVVWRSDGVLINFQPNHFPRRARALPVRLWKCVIVGVTFCVRPPVSKKEYNS